MRYLPPTYHIFYFIIHIFYVKQIKVNPDPDVSSDPEIDILKDIFENDDEPSAPPSKFPDDTSLEFYDEEQSIGNIQNQRGELEKLLIMKFLTCFYCRRECRELYCGEQEG